MQTRGGAVTRVGEEMAVLTPSEGQSPRNESCWRVGGRGAQYLYSLRAVFYKSRDIKITSFVATLRANGLFTGIEIEYSSTSGNILLGVSASLFKVLQYLLHASMMWSLEFRGVVFFSGFTKRASIRGFSSKKLTTVSFQAFRNQNKRFAVMTAYDYPSARHCSLAEIDMVLVGDSLGMVSFLPFSLAAKLSLSSLVFQIGHAWI